MPSRPSINCFTATWSLSLLSMNLAANSTIPLPSVTSVTLAARAASSFSTGEGNGNGDGWANAGTTSAAAPNMIAAKRCFMLDSPLFLRTLFRDSPLLCVLVSFLQLPVHHLERVIGDAKRGEHLLFCFFSLAALDGVMPGHRAACDACNHQRGSDALEPDHAAALPRALMPALLHHLALQACGRWLALQGFAQLTFEFVDMLKR